jgi:YesN/AraC family two-component response regulator
MSKMNGVELAAEIRRIRPQVKVLFCSGYPAAALARQGLDLTPGEFLMKPVSLAALAAKLECLLSRDDTAST